MAKEKNVKLWEPQHYLWRFVVTLRQTLFSSLLYGLSVLRWVQILSLLTLASWSVIGQPHEMLVNGSFEGGETVEISNQLDPDTFDISGWNLASGNIDYIGKRWRASDGRKCIDLNGVAPGTIEQAISNLVIGSRYRLSFEMAVNPEAPPSQTLLLVSIAGVSNQYRMLRPGTKTNLRWRRQSLEFEAASATAVLRLASMNRFWAGPVLDNFSLRTKEPMPRTSPSKKAFGLESSFSTNANPNGNWWYGWKANLDSPLLLLTTARTTEDSFGNATFSWQLNESEWPAVSTKIADSPICMPGNQSRVVAGQITIAPGMTDAPENYGVARFLAPTNGFFWVETGIEAAHEGLGQGDCDFHLLTNKVEVAGLYVAPHLAMRFTNIFYLQRGDSIDYAVGRGWDGKHLKSQIAVKSQIRLHSDPP